MRRRLSDAEAERVLEAERKRRRQWLSDVPIFAAVASQDNAEEFLTAVAEKLEVKTVGRKECVVSKGEFGAEMYFIVRGEAEVLAELGDAPFAQLGVGSFFGEGALLEGGGERNAFVRAVKSLQLFVLTKAHLEQVFEGFPAAEAAIKNPLDDRRAEREVAEQTRAEDDAEEGVPPVEDEELDEEEEQESDSEPEQEQEPEGREGMEQWELDLLEMQDRQEPETTEQPQEDQDEPEPAVEDKEQEEQEE